MVIQSSSQSKTTVAESILRFNQISAGRCIVGIILGAAFILFGSSTLLLEQSEAGLGNPVMAIFNNR
jgi:hypothetical protein